MSSNDQLLLDLGQQAGLGAPLQFNERGCARLMVDGRIGLDFEADADAGTIQVYSVLGEVPLAGREALYRQLLEANLFGSATAGATLAIDEQTNEIVLCRTVTSEETSAAAFARLVENFIAAAEEWLQKIADFTSPAPDAAGAQSSAAANGSLGSLPPGAFLRA